MAAVACAGPLAIYLLSAVLFTAHAAGESQATTKVLVALEMPAGTAGLRDGDEVLSVDGSARPD